MRILKSRYNIKRNYRIISAYQTRIFCTSCKKKLLKQSLPLSTTLFLNIIRVIMSWPLYSTSKEPLVAVHIRAIFNDFEADQELCVCDNDTNLRHHVTTSASCLVESLSWSQMETSIFWNRHSHVNANLK